MATQKVLHQKASLDPTVILFLSVNCFEEVKDHQTGKTFNTRENKLILEKGKNNSKHCSLTSKQANKSVHFYSEVMCKELSADLIPLI